MWLPYICVGRARLITCRDFVVTAVVAMAIAVQAQITDGAAAKLSRPHIVHVVMDDIGHNDLGFANPAISTPFIDALAIKHGLQLTHFYTAKECAPTRGALMTGRMPYHFGYYRNPSDEGGVPLEYKLLPQVLAASPAKYISHAVGKWHLGFKTKNHTATYRGFDSWMGYYHWGEDYFSHEFPPAYKGATACRGIDFNDNVGHDLTAVGPDSPLIGVYSLDIFTAQVSRIIHSHAELMEKAQSPRNEGNHSETESSASVSDPVAPLFLYVAWQNCHDPYDVPQKYIDLYRDVSDLERRNMSAMISALDVGVGATVADLNSTGMWSSTLMTVHTDNGGELPFASGGKPGIPNENGGAGNNFPLRGEGGIRGRAFITGGVLPEIHRGKVFPGLMSVADWLPTYAALAGISPQALGDIATGPRPLDGFDFSGVLLNASGSMSITQGAEAANPDRLGSAWTDVPRTEIVHKPLNQGYPGDNRTVLPPDENEASYPLAAGGLAYSALAARQLDTMDTIQSLEALVFQPPQSGPCVQAPCLFDLSKDPGEINDLASEQTAMVAELTAVLHQAGSSGYPPVEGSDGSPTSEAECAMVNKTGNWQPWV